MSGRSTDASRPSSARLRFGVWSTNDLDLAGALWGNPEVMRFLGGPYTPDQIAARLEREIENERSAGIQYWPLFLSEDGRHAGCCGLKPFDPALRQYEIGFHLLPRFWGAGYAFEAASAVIRWAFGSLDAAALFAGHHPENDASRGLVERLGFKRIGTHFYAPTGLDHPWYRLDRPAPSAR